MYIVGTSGHIDHGKTSLIAALTGTNCDRLPEEKEREMTIDIGFASIEYPKFGTVSIIDVPGHERFIRNMVVGAWGVDLALLVVAVDDGWMPQTEDHFRVLELLGVERIVVVMNKVDLADEEMVEFVEEEVREKIGETRFAESDIVKVSSKTGQGIEELREAIVVNLRKLAKIADAKKPYLFIDRVFASKGYGTVITGTLKNGAFNEDDTVEILPVKKEARIKRIESHFSTKQEGNPSQRTALNLSGVSVDDIKRGSLVCGKNFFTETGDMIARIKLLPGQKGVKNNHEIEVLIGTTAIKGKIIFIGGDREEGSEFAARMKFEKPWYFYPGEPFVITSPGGYRILGGGTVLLPDYNAKTMKTRVKEALANITANTREEILEFIFAVHQWKNKKEVQSAFPESPKKTDKVLESLREKKKIEIMSDIILTRDYLEKSISSIAAEIEKSVGLNLKEISDHAGVNMEVSRILMPAVLKAHTIIEKEGRYFSGDSITEDALPESKKKILSDIRAQQANGLELEKLKDDQKKKDIRDLIKLDFLISLDGNIIYHKEIYEDFRDKIIKLFDNNDKITVPEAKDAVGLSRKYILPLLNRIENEGLIKRLGDFRIKV
ncbi:MAG: selenocysteine-specific translation elongation factor [bacterium]|nr:selenocysteine-specific translation elongation factor [bacterium]